STIAWMDWSGVERSDFVPRTCEWLERAVDRGAKGIKFWKDLGLRVRDGSGQLLRIDDERLAPLFDKAAALRIPVMFHTADPDASSCPWTSETNATKSWPHILTGAFIRRSTRSQNCSTSEIACLCAIRLRRSSRRMWRRAG